MYGGEGVHEYVAYIGIAKNLRQRIRQHLIRRDSSVTTGTTAVSLNPDYITKISWWTHDDFIDRVLLETAELVAFEIFDPALRSRGGISQKAKNLFLDKDAIKHYYDLFSSAPDSFVQIHNLKYMVSKLRELEVRIEKLEVSKNQEYSGNSI
ncbi:hypothetical protein ACFLXI_03430 [Chloroflexota bacterium]